jgi:hypothetical protein
MSSSTLKLLVLVNALVALLCAGATLVLLLIAPLGLAAVLACTLLVGLISFGAGLAGDLVIWRRTRSDAIASAAGAVGLVSTAGLPLPQRESSQVLGRARF